MSCFHCNCISAIRYSLTTDDHSEPKLLIALLNLKSGGGKAIQFKESLKQIPNCTVFNISEIETDECREQFLDLIKDSEEKCRIIVGGGDGTITWAIKILKALEIKVPMAILPLGTANELSSCTGWGRRLALSNLMQQISVVKKEKTFDLDLWKIKHPTVSETNIGRKPRIMACFLSFGLDARIALNFHKQRQLSKKQPSVNKSKSQYVIYNFKEQLKQSPVLNDLIKIKIGKNELELNISSKIRCLQVLNVRTMSNGVNFFGSGKSNNNDLLQEGEYDKPKFNDGKIEIVGISSVHHYNQCYLNLRRGIRLAQCDFITLEIKKEIPMQIDGEPFMCSEGKLVICNYGVQRIIKGKKFGKNVNKDLDYS